LGALPYLPCTVRPAWERGSLGACLGGRLPANAVRVRLGLGLAAGGGAASPSVLASRCVDTQKIKILKRARPLCRLRQIKKPPSNGGMPSLSRIGLENQQRILLGRRVKKIMLGFVFSCVY